MYSLWAGRSAGLFRALLVVCWCQLAIGCITYAVPFQPKSKPDPKQGYLVTRVVKTPASGLTGAMDAGLVVENAARTRRYVIKFTESGALTVIQVLPDTYVMTGFVAQYPDGTKAGEKRINERPFGVAFCVREGNAYYVGDHRSRGDIGTFVQTWEISGSSDRFETAKVDLERGYPHLAGLPFRRAFEPPG